MPGTDERAPMARGRRALHWRPEPAATGHTRAMQQSILVPVLALVVFAVALDLRPEDLRYVVRRPLAVGAGLTVQFLLLPVATWLATLALPLAPATEAAMMLVAACPGGALSNAVTLYGRGNVALSLSLTQWLPGVLRLPPTSRNRPCPQACRSSRRFWVLPSSTARGGRSCSRRWANASWCARAACWRTPRSWHSKRTRRARRSRANCGWA
jgi:hypothetical protein